MDAWLTEILNLLDLHVDFLNKISKCAQDAVARAMQVESMMELAHIHFLSFAPADLKSKGQIWGLFRIKKVDDFVQYGETADHLVELFLYLEG